MHSMALYRLFLQRKYAIHDREFTTALKITADQPTKKRNLKAGPSPVKKWSFILFVDFEDYLQWTLVHQI